MHYSLAILTVSFLSLVTVSNSVKVAPQTNLPLECAPIPKHTEQLCVGITPTPYGPFDDVVIYSKTIDGQLTLLESIRNQVGVFAGMGFSNGGRLMWVSWAEEGHGSFAFYDTQHYLAEGSDAKPLGQLSDYHLDHLYSFTDDGVVAYMTDEDSSQGCANTSTKANTKSSPNKKDHPDSYVDPVDKNTYCLKYLFLPTGK